MTYSGPNGSAALNTNGIKQEAQHISNGDVKVNNWSHAGPAAFDFRSDTITTPTTRMLSAITATTLLDDVYQADPTTNSLEAFCADLTAHEAALFVVSGSMGNQIALRTHLAGPPHSILTDHRSHILEWEAGGAAVLCGALVKGVVPANGKYLTLEDVKKHAVLSEDVHKAPTRLISLENTLGGVITPLEECKRISAWAREHGIKTHLDGARLWNAVAAGAGGLEEYGRCFDSVSLCFSKGLGAPVGSVLVGGEAFIRKARHIRKMIGGGLRQAGVLTAAARVSVEDTFMGGKLQASHERAKEIEGMWTGYGGKLTDPVETNMVWFDLEAAGISVEDFIALGDKAGVRLGGGRLVVHYQIEDEAVRRLDEVMKAVLKGKALNGTVDNDTKKMQLNTE